MTAASGKRHDVIDVGIRFCFAIRAHTPMPRDQTPKVAFGYDPGFLVALASPATMLIRLDDFRPRTQPRFVLGLLSVHVVSVVLELLFVSAF